MRDWRRQGRHLTEITYENRVSVPATLVVGTESASGICPLPLQGPTMKLRAIALAMSLGTGVIGTGHAAVVDGTIIRTGGEAVGTDAPWFRNVETVQSTINRHYFQVNTAGAITFDILSWEGGANALTTSPPTDVNGDGEIAFFDAMIHVFNAETNALIATNDDNSILGADGSIYNRDSYLTSALAVGNYFVAVGSFELSVSDVFAGMGTDSGPMTWNGSRYVVGDHGDYRLTITGDANLIPEPSSVALVGLSLFGLGVVRRRRL
jgi:PEP-CTERM motif